MSRREVEPERGVREACDRQGNVLQQGWQGGMQRPEAHTLTQAPELSTKLRDHPGYEQHDGMSKAKNSSFSGLDLLKRPLRSRLALEATSISIVCCPRLCWSPRFMWMSTVLLQPGRAALMSSGLLPQKVMWMFVVCAGA